MLIAIFILYLLIFFNKTKKIDNKEEEEEESNNNSDNGTEKAYFDAMNQQRSNYCIFFLYLFMFFLTFQRQ